MPIKLKNFPYYSTKFFHTNWTNFQVNISLHSLYITRHYCYLLRKTIGNKNLFWQFRRHLTKSNIKVTFAVTSTSLSNSNFTESSSTSTFSFDPKFSINFSTYLDLLKHNTKCKNKLFLQKSLQEWKQNYKIPLHIHFNRHWTRSFQNNLLQN